MIVGMDKKLAISSSPRPMIGGKFHKEICMYQAQAHGSATLRGRMKVWIQGGSGCGSMVDPRWIQVDLGGSAFFECYKVLQIMGQAGWIRRDHLPLL